MLLFRVIYIALRLYSFFSSCIPCEFKLWP